MHDLTTKMKFKLGLNLTCQEKKFKAFPKGMQIAHLKKKHHFIFLSLWIPFMKYEFEIAHICT